MKVRRLPKWVKNDYDLELYHHGIKGQHWGVKNGPPYPLDRKVSASIKRGENEDRHSAKNTGTSHDAGAVGNWYAYGLSMYPNDFDEFKRETPKDYQSLYRISNLGLKDVNKFPSEMGGEWKNALEDKDLQSLFESNFKNDPSGEKVLTIKQGVKEAINTYGFTSGNVGMDLLKSVNDTFGAGGAETHNNCSKCSDVVEMIQRGFDPTMFEAGRTRFGMFDSANEYHWDGAIPYKEKSYENIENRIKSFGNKASGVISIRRADGSGHAMHFSSVKDAATGERRIEVQDGQVAKVYKNLSEALTRQGHDPTQFCKITRLDCATPNIKHMIEDNVLRVDPEYMKSGTKYGPRNEDVWTGMANTMDNFFTRDSYDKGKWEDQRRIKDENAF